MLYCTYDQYAAAGGTLDEAAFAPLAARASRLIDRMTFGRAEGHAAVCEGCAEALADACIQIIDAANAVQSACTPPGVSSVSNDGVSMTFTSGALAERLAAEAQDMRPLPPTSRASASRRRSTTLPKRTRPPGSAMPSQAMPP